MRSIVKWIIFVPVCLLSLLLIFFSCLAPESVHGMLGADANSVARIVAFAVVGVFALFVLFSLFDRSTSPIHLLKKNYFCGITGVLSAFTMAAIVALDASSMFRTGEIDVMSVLTLIFTALAAVAMLFMGLNHFTGTNSPRAIAILYLALPLWSGVHLVSRFLAHTASPVAAADTLDLVMFVSLALSSLYFVMVQSQITGKNAVKSAVVFGAPTVIATLAFAITQYFAVASLVSSDILSYIPAFCYTLLGLYVFGFTAELSFASKTNDEQMIIEPVEVEDTDEHDEEPAEEDAAELSFASKIDDEQLKTESDEEQNTEESGLFDGTFSTPEYADEKIDESDEPEKDGFALPVASKVRVVDFEPADAEEDKESAVSADDEMDSLRELYSFAKNRDNDSVDFANDTDKSETDIDFGSDEEMIIKDEKEQVAPQKSAPANAPKGKTVREPIFTEDDFIISINDKDRYDMNVTVNNDEDASTYIMESFVRPENENDGADKSYESKLDEIDQLIISIESGKQRFDRQENQEE